MESDKVALRIYGYDKDDLPGTLEVLKKHGFRSVVGHGDTDAASFFSGNGIEYYAVHKCFHADEAIDLPENLCEDIEGNVTKWFGSACPNSPATIENSLLAAKALASVPGISGIIVDGARFASPASGEGENAFFTCFCDNCTAKMMEMGFSPEAIKSSVSALYTHIKTGHGFDLSVHRDGIKAWLSFRGAVITRYLKRYADSIREANPTLKIGIYIFAPSLALLVGQSYPDLADIFDFLSPMLYRHYDAPVGTACLDHEITALLKLVDHLDPAQKAPVLALYQELFGLPVKDLPSISELRREGCPIAFVENEIREAKLKAGGQAEVSPIFMLKDRYLKNCIQACVDNGIQTVDFFHYEADSVKAFS